MLSNAEAERVALSEAVKEVMILTQFLECMKISVKLQVTVSVDIVEAILMAGNTSTTSYTKHVDIRYKNVNVYVKDREAKFIFIKSAGMTATFLQTA